MTTHFSDIQETNAAFVDSFSGQDVPGQPAKRMLLITCMDCRIVPHAALGVSIGDMKVIRNGGGQLNPEVEKDVVIANHVLSCDRILIMQHTRCGMAAATLDVVRELVHNNTGQDTSNFTPNVIANQQSKLEADVASLRNNPLLKSDVQVEGAIYDVDTGKINFI